MALPWLDAMAESSSATDAPMRMACVGLNFGLVPQLFFPEKTGTDYVLTDRLRPLKEFRDDFTVFSGLDHGVNAQGGHGGVHAYLSGVLSKNSSGMPEANISIDQKAEPLEPDTRGTATIREQLDKHRSVASCAECHRRIDPAGFALEYFDPIGGYRTRYPARGNRGPEVNGSGQLPSGESFEDERGLKQLLVARKDRFAETLTEKLLTYATGRRMTFRDQAEIKQIAMSASQTGYGLRDLIIGVATSETFRQR